MASEAITYDVSKFNPQPGSEVLCAICHCVLFQPRMCICRHIFCRVCIETWLNRSSTCPTCRNHTGLRQLQLAPPLVQSILNSLTMDCDYKEKGCTYLVPMENFPTHIAQCDYRAAFCPHVGCKSETTVADLARHKEECQFRIEHCRKECGLPFPLNKLEGHVCTTAMRERVGELNSILHKHQVVLRWLRGKMNAMYMPQQTQGVQLQAFNETLDDINRFWPPDQPIPQRLCGSYIASATPASATATSQNNAAEAAQEAGQGGNSILERLVSEASNPQEQQRRRGIAPRYPDEVERWSYQARGRVWRTLERYAVERRTSPPQSPSPPLGLDPNFPRSPRYIPLEDLRPERHHPVLPVLFPALHSTADRASQSAAMRSPLRRVTTPPDLPPRDSPPHLEGRARSSRDRSPTPFPDVFRSDNEGGRSYGSDDTTDDDFSSDSGDYDSYSALTPRSPTPADRDYEQDRRRDDYDMYWSYRHRRTTESADYSPQYSPERDGNRHRSRSYYSRSRSRSYHSRSRSRSNYDRSRSHSRYSRSRSRGYSRSWSRDRTYDRPRRNNRSRSRSHSRPRSRSISNRRLGQPDGSRFSRSSSRSRNRSPPRRSVRSRSRSQSWNRRRVRNDNDSYHSHDPVSRSSNQGHLTNGSRGWGQSEDRRSSEERGHWAPDSSHTNNTDDDDDDDDGHSDRRRPWLNSVGSQSQQHADATDASYPSPGGSSARSDDADSRHDSQSRSRRRSHRGRETVSDSDSWASHHSPDAVHNSPENGNESAGDRTWSTTTTDEHSDLERNPWPVSGTEAEGDDQRSSPQQATSEHTPSHEGREESGDHTDSAADRHGSRPPSPVPAAFSSGVSSSSASSRVSAWHARSASRSKRTRHRGKVNGSNREETSAQPQPSGSLPRNDTAATKRKTSHDKKKTSDTDIAQRSGGTAASCEEKNNKALDQEASKNVWETSSDTTSLDYDLADEEPSPTAIPKAASSTARDDANTSHSSGSVEQNNALVDTGNAEPNAGLVPAELGTGENSSAADQSKAEDPQTRTGSNEQASSSQGQTSRLLTNSDKEEQGKGTKGKSRKGSKGKGKGKALLKSKRNADTENSNTSDGDRHSDFNSHFKGKAKGKRRHVLSSSECSDAEQIAKDDGKGLNTDGNINENSAAISDLPSTSSVALAQPVRSTSNENSGRKKSRKSVKKDSVHSADGEGNRDSPSHDRHSKKRKAKKSKRSRPSKKAKLEDNTAVGANNREGHQSSESARDPRPSNASVFHSTLKHPQMSLPVPSFILPSISVIPWGAGNNVGQAETQTRAEAASADRPGVENGATGRGGVRTSGRGRRSTDRTRERSGEDANRLARPSETTASDRHGETRGVDRHGETTIADIHNENRSSNRHSDTGATARHGETRTVEEGTHHTRIMRVETSERSGGRAPRRIMRIENPVGQHRASERRAAGEESLRMVRIPDLPVPPSTLELLNQYAYSDESDATWSPTSDDDDDDYVYDERY